MIIWLLILKNLYGQEIIYKITYSNLSPGNSVKYEIYIYSNYNAKINKTSNGSFVGATPITSQHRKYLSKNNKKYLKDILDNIDRYTEEGVGKSFTIYNVSSQKEYHIEFGTKEAEILEYIFIFGEEIESEENMNKQYYKMY